jgi:hypothetical protein
MIFFTWFTGEPYDSYLTLDAIYKIYKQVALSAQDVPGETKEVYNANHIKSEIKQHLVNAQT